MNSGGLLPKTGSLQAESSSNAAGTLPRTTRDAFVAHWSETDGNPEDAENVPTRLDLLTTVPSGTRSLADQAEDCEVAVLTQVVEASKRPWIFYTLTLKHSTQDRLVECHALWRELHHRRLGAVDLAEYRVFEDHESGDPHVHGIFELPEESELPPRLRDGLRCSGFRYIEPPVVRSSVHGNRPWVVQEAERIWVRITGGSSKHAANVGMLDLSKPGIRYCAKTFTVGGDRDFLGRWPTLQPPKAQVSQRPGKSRGRPSTPLDLARFVIQHYIIARGVTDARAIQAIVDACGRFGLNWFSPRTFKRAKQECGVRSIVTERRGGRIRRWSLSTSLRRRPCRTRARERAVTC